MHYYNNYHSTRMIRPPVMNQKPKRLTKTKTLSMEWLNQSSILLLGFFALLVILCAVFMGKNLALNAQISSLESQIAQLTSLNTRALPITYRHSNVTADATVPEHEVPVVEEEAATVVENVIEPVESAAPEIQTVAMEPYMEPTIETVVEEAIAEPIVINTSDITSPSNLNVDEIDAVIMATHETYGYSNSGSMLHGIGQYLYNAEQTYGINALYILSVATWEGGWGTSNAAVNYNNSYGLMTNSGLMRFSSVEEGVMDFARRMREYYFDCGRTEPYSIGKKYCPGNATRWGDKISLIMSMYADHV